MNWHYSRPVSYRLSIAFFTWLLCAGSVSAVPRQIVSLDFDWQFHRGDYPGILLDSSTNGSVSPTGDFLSPAYDDSSWQTVDVPHDYVVEGTFDTNADEAHGYLPVDAAWYRKMIFVPPAEPGRRRWLEFDGIYRDSQMWLNSPLKNGIFSNTRG